MGASCEVQAAALGGQLVAHCRREADLGLVTPQELLQSAQRQRCYLGYIPQPPQVGMHLTPPSWPLSGHVYDSSSNQGMHACGARWDLV